MKVGRSLIYPFSHLTNVTGKRRSVLSAANAAGGAVT
jgi:hypothetical protein